MATIQYGFPLVQGLISAGTHRTGTQFPYFSDSGKAVPTEMNGPTGTQSSQQFPLDFRSLIKTLCNLHKTEHNVIIRHLGSQKGANLYLQCTKMHLAAGLRPDPLES